MQDKEKTTKGFKIWGTVLVQMYQGVHMGLDLQLDISQSQLRVLDPIDGLDSPAFDSAGERGHKGSL